MKDQIQYLEPYSLKEDDDTICKLYHDFNKMQGRDLSELENRINFFSQRFLSKPYLRGALGEGIDGKFDQSPLYRLDAFDCVTFVNTVLALALSHSLSLFKKNLVKIAYHSERPSYLFRNHFISADWNKHNANSGIIQDITKEIRLSNNAYLNDKAITKIDRPNWFRARQFNDIKLIKKIKKEKADLLLNEMHHLADRVKSEIVETPYLPLKIVVQILEQIPQATIIEIIRPNWDLREEIGTHLNVSHLGFAIWRNGQLYFRHASPINKKVEEVLMIDYLFKQMENPLIKGINLQQAIYTQGN